MEYSSFTEHRTIVIFVRLVTVITVSHRDRDVTVTVMTVTVTATYVRMCHVGDAAFLEMSEDSSDIGECVQNVVASIRDFNFTDKAMNMKTTDAVFERLCQLPRIVSFQIIYRKIP